MTKKTESEDAGKRYRSVDTGESIGFYNLAYSALFGAYSIEPLGNGALLINGERYELELVTEGDDDAE